MAITLDIIRDILPQAKSYSGYISGICPFHNDSKPSLMVYPDGFFRCLGCGTVGSFEKLYRALTGRNASRVIPVVEDFKPPRLPTDLTEQEDLVEKAHYSLTRFEQLRWYLENRGVDGRIEACRLGWYRGWYVIPIYSKTGEYQGMMLRAGASIQKATGMRFVQPFGQKPMMYCPDWSLLESAKSIAIVFGMFDALALSELRIPVVTSIGGQDSFNPLWLESYRKRAIVLPDKDEEKAGMKLSGRLGWRGAMLKLTYPPEIKDPAGFLELGKQQLLMSQIGGLFGC